MTDTNSLWEDLIGAEEAPPGGLAGIAKLCSGYGQTHTNEAAPDKPDKRLRPYITIDLEGIRALVDKPQQVDKRRAQWLIPSTLASRSHARQELDGEFWLLWADLDENPRPLEELADFVNRELQTDFEAYTSRSATIGRQKARVLVPLASPLSGPDWRLAQRALGDLLEAGGFTPDRAAEGTGQLCYLPNRGEFYDSRSVREGRHLDAWASALGRRMREQHALAERKKAEAEHQAAERAARRASLVLEEAPDTIGAFNQAYSVEDILLEAGYAQDGDRFRHPASESGSYSASVRGGRVHTLSTRDPLWSDGRGAHDAFSAFVVLMHNGDRDAALRDAGDTRLTVGGESWNAVQRRRYAAEQEKKKLAALLDDLPPEQAREAAASALETMFGPSSTARVMVPDSIRMTMVGRLAQRVAAVLELPEASALLALLGSVSAAVSTAYAVQYATGTSIPLGLYCVVEQPPATQKSRLLGIGLEPYLRAMRDHNSTIRAHNALEESDSLPLGFVNATDATTAGLDAALSGLDSGRFVIASAEQAAFASLFPKDATFVTNNELALKGYPGEFVASIRRGRESFTGHAYGTIVLVAQPGSAKRVLAASEGSGLAERFLYLSEPTLLGQRKLRSDFLSRDELAPFTSAIEGCIADYTARVMATAAGSRPTLEPGDLSQLCASAGGYSLILEHRRAMEPRLGALLDRGETTLLSWLGKVETHALKVAAVLHVTESKAAGCEVPPVIPANLIQAALELLAALGHHLRQVLHANGEGGEAAEVEAVFALLAQRPAGRTATIVTLRNRTPFKAAGSNAYKTAKSRIDAMLEAGLLVTDTKGNLRAV